MTRPATMSPASAPNSLPGLPQPLPQHVEDGYAPDENHGRRQEEHQEKNHHEEEDYQEVQDNAIASFVKARSNRRRSWMKHVDVRVESLLCNINDLNEYNSRFTNEIKAWANVEIMDMEAAILSSRKQDKEKLLQDIQEKLKDSIVSVRASVWNATKKQLIMLESRTASLTATAAVEEKRFNDMQRTIETMQNEILALRNAPEHDPTPIPASIPTPTSTPIPIPTPVVPPFLLNPFPPRQHQHRHQRFHPYGNTQGNVVYPHQEYRTTNVPVKARMPLLRLGS